MKLRVALGHCVRQIRWQKGLSMRDLSGSSGISIAHISEFERGIKEMSSELLEALCKGLECKQSELMLEAYRVVVKQENRRETTRT